VIEVSDSTVAYDRKDKGPAYARNHVGEYWLLNLADNALISAEAGVGWLLGFAGGRTHSIHFGLSQDGH